MHFSHYIVKHFTAITLQSFYSYFAIDIKMTGKLFMQGWYVLSRTENRHKCNKLKFERVICAITIHHLSLGTRDRTQEDLIDDISQQVQCDK